MSKAPKQRKVQLHYQPYQQSNGGSILSNTNDATAIATTTMSSGLALSSNGSATGTSTMNSSSGSSSSSSAMDYGLSDLPLHMDPVLAGFSSSLSRNVWDDWNDSDPNMMKFDMFTDDAMATPPQSSSITSTVTTSSTGATTSTSTIGTMGGFVASMLAAPSAHPNHETHQSMDVDTQRHDASSFHSMIHGMTSGSGDLVASQPRLSVKRSLSEDLVSMLDDHDDDHHHDHNHDHHSDPFVTSDGLLNKQHLPPGFSFQSPQHEFSHGTMNGNSDASPLHGQHPPHKQPRQQQQQQHQQEQQQQQHQQPYPPFQQLQPQQQQQQSHSHLVQHATNWLHGFPANSPQHQHQQNQHQQQNHQHQQNQQQPYRQQQQTPPPLSPAAAARLAAHQQRPEPSAMERASAAISSTMVAIPNPCKESSPPPPPQTTPSAASNNVAPSPFSAYSFMAQAAASGEGTSENGGAGGGGAGGAGGGGAATFNPFAGNPNAGMMMPGFMMYSMPMMGNYQAAAAAAAAMGMMPMGAMPMNGMNGMAGMGGMNGMNGMSGMAGMNPMQMGAMGPMMGMAPHTMMQMAASMGMPMAGTAMDGLGLHQSGDSTLKMKMAAAPLPPKALQPKNAVIALAPASVSATPGNGAAGASSNASFVSIARKPDEPEVSTILKSLMEEEAKKKEKKLERNRDSARESRKKQQTYVETLENGIKRLQLNREVVVSYRWGVTGGGPGEDQLRDRLDVVTGKTEAFATLQNPTNFQNLMRINRQRRALSLARGDKERAIVKCFVCVGQQLAALRKRLLELQVFRSVVNPASGSAGHQLASVLQLTDAQKQQLESHTNRVFDVEVLAMVKLFKVFFALRTQALRLNLMAPELESYFREVCSMEQLQKLLQWTELQRTLIEGSSGAAHGLSLLT